MLLANSARVHRQWPPGIVMVELGYLMPQTQAALEKMGYCFRIVPSWRADEAILKGPKTGLLEGANGDRRASGLAAGY